ncbi:MAG: alginate lyase family protein [Puniceicoccaceae bacterium]
MTRCLALIVSLLIAIPSLASDVVLGEFVASNANRLNKLFDQLDPAHPEVGQLVEQWNSGQHIEAAGRLAAYYESKAFAQQILEPLNLGADPVHEAELALQNQFIIHDTTVELLELPEGSLEWNLESQDLDKELAWMLNRHTFLPLLAEAGSRTGNAAYRAKLNELWQSWITENPSPGKLSFSAQWRALEVARRILNSWTHVFYDRESLDPSSLLIVLSSIPDHAEILKEHASFWGGNHLITEKLALLTLATAWPEFQQAAEWREDAIASLSEQFLKQTYPDGSYKELSNHYQKVILRSAHQFLIILAQTEQDMMERPVAKRIEKLWEFFAYSTRPDGYGPLNNASDLENNANLLKGVWRFYNRPDWQVIANRMTKDLPGSDSPTRLFPWAGQAFIRNHFRQDGDWIYFDAGPYGTAHQHVDRLHVSACFNGRPIIVDSGRYTYQHGSWREYFKGPASHSVLQLDGKASEQGPREVKSPMPLIFEESEDHVFTAASASFKSASGRHGLPTLRAGVPWTRAILYDNRGFAIIFDHVLAFTEHDFSLTWNLHPDIPGDSYADVLRIVESPVHSRAAVSEGWHSPEYGVKQACKQLVLRGRIDSPTTIVTMIGGGMARKYGFHPTSEVGSPILNFRISWNGKTIAEAGVRLHPNPELIQYEKILLTEDDR